MLLALGPHAWNGLFPYIEDEDIGVARAVVAALNELVEATSDSDATPRFKTDRSTEETQPSIRACWEEWYRSLSPSDP